MRHPSIEVNMLSKEMKMITKMGRKHKLIKERFYEDTNEDENEDIYEEDVEYDGILADKAVLVYEALLDYCNRMAIPLCENMKITDVMAFIQLSLD